MANGTEPTIWDFLKYGRSAPNVARDRYEYERAEQLLPLLAELKQLEQSNKPKVETKYNIDLPGSEGFSYQNQVDLARSLRALKIDQDDFNETLQADQLSGAIADLQDPAQRVNALNKKDVSPINVSGGNLYNRFDTNNPQILDESSAVSSLARQRAAKAEETEMRNRALGDILDNPETDPLTRATVANSNTTFKPDRVKVRNRNGELVYMDAIPKLGGGYEYRPANDEQGAPLRVPPSSPGAIEKDAELFQTVFGFDKEEATRRALSLRQHLKTASPEDAWATLVEFTARQNYGRYLRDPEDLYAKAAEIWSVKFPNRPIPSQDTLAEMFPDVDTGQGSRNDPAAPAPSPAPAQAAPELPEQEEVRQRAIAEGYDTLGAWVPGRGFEVLNESGKIIGYYY